MADTRFRAVVADLMASITSGAYDQNQTVIRGRMTQKLVEAQQCLGGPLNVFIDTFNQAAITPNLTLHLTPSGRLFVLQAISAGIGTLGLWIIDLNTMTVLSHPGRINLTFPNAAATTHTLRYFKAQDTGAAGWRIYVGTTGSVVINGGTFLANNIDLADFAQVGFPTIPMATGTGQKAVYFLQDPAFQGAAHTAANLASVAIVGGLLDRSANRLYVHDGIAASHRYHVLNTSLSPAWTSFAVTGNDVTDRINQTGHPFIAGDQLVFTALTGGAGLATATVYFVVNPTANDYQLSATSGGAAINFTTAISAATIGRAFGISPTQFIHRTGNLPALTGTLLTTDSEDYAEITGFDPAVNGFPCAFFATNSQLYIGRLSELTAGATTWPSLRTVNLLGSANQITAPTAVQASWSTVLNRAIYTTSVSVFVAKQMANNSIDYIFGGLNNEFQEGMTKPNIALGLVTVGGLDLESGILAVSGVTVGQRGVFLCDIRSQAEFDYSYIITKVLSTPQAIYRYLATFDKLFEFTGSNVIYYRTSGFASESGGWLPLPYGDELEGITTPGAQVQFKIYSDHLGLDTCIPAQIYDLLLGYESQIDNSEHWQTSIEQSTRSTEVPAYSVGVLVNAYATAVPAIRFAAYSRATGSLVIEKFTDTNASEFSVSTDSGLTFSPLGTIPNVINTTRLRYNWSTPIPQDVDIVWEEK